MIGVVDTDISTLNNLILTDSGGNLNEVQLVVSELLGKVDEFAQILVKQGVEDSGISSNSTVVIDKDFVLRKIEFYFKRLNECIEVGDELALNYAMCVCSLLRESLMSIVQYILFKPLKDKQMA